VSRFSAETRLGYACIANARLKRLFTLRVWVRSIVLREKLVKKKSQSNHKIFGGSCRNHLFIVVPTRFACFAPPLPAAVRCKQHPAIDMRQPTAKNK